MKKLFFLSVLSLLVFLFYSCEAPSGKLGWKETQDGKLKVLSTTAMIDDLVKQIGKEHIETQILIQGDLDPHTYQLVKGDDEKLIGADIIFFNGLGLEHGSGLLLHLQESGKSASVGDHLLHTAPEEIFFLDGQPDPHIWMDIHLFAKIVPFIVQTLSQKDPQHSQYFKENGDKLYSLLLKNHEQIALKLAELPESKRYLVTSHDAFNYFTRAYLSESEEANLGTWQKRCQAPEGLSPERQLSTRDIKRIVEHLKTFHISVLFPESNVNKDSIKKIINAGKQAGLKISIAPCSLFADAMGPKGSSGDTYLKMIWHNAEQIFTHLNGNDTSSSH